MPENTRLEIINDHDIHWLRFELITYDGVDNITSDGNISLDAAKQIRDINSGRDLDAFMFVIRVMFESHKNKLISAYSV